jgi:uncharacterized membrane protein YeaQ/YmgE (transglycosylase-associated protein family)
MRRRARGTITKRQEIQMSYLAWIALGLVVGFIANKLVNNGGEGLFMNITFGTVGAIFGGELINKIGMAEAPRLTLWSVLVSVGGAVLFLVVYHTLLSARSKPTV